MVPIDTIIQDVIQVLSSSAWTGVGVIISSVISTAAFINSLHLTTPSNANEQYLKKNPNHAKEVADR